MAGCCIFSLWSAPSHPHTYRVNFHGLVKSAYRAAVGERERAGPARMTTSTSIPSRSFCRLCSAHILTRPISFSIFLCVCARARPFNCFILPAYFFCQTEFQRRQFLERMGEAFLLAVLDEYCGALQSLGSDLFGFLQNLGSVYQEMKTAANATTSANQYDISFSCVPEQGRLTLHFRTAVAACGYLWAGILKVRRLLIPLVILVEFAPPLMRLDQPRRDD